MRAPAARFAALTGAVSLYAWGFNPFGHAFFVMNFFHAWQYFAIVWSTDKKNVDSPETVEVMCMCGHPEAAFDGPRGRLHVAVTDRVTCASAATAPAPSSGRAQRRPVDADAWRQLDGFAQRTFAPATEAERSGSPASGTGERRGAARTLGPEYPVPVGFPTRPTARPGVCYDAPPRWAASFPGWQSIGISLKSFAVR